MAGEIFRSSRFKRQRRRCPYLDVGKHGKAAEPYLDIRGLHFNYPYLHFELFANH